MREEAIEYVVAEGAWGVVSGGREGVATVDHMDMTGPCWRTAGGTAGTVSEAALPPDCAGSGGSDGGRE